MVKDDHGRCPKCGVDLNGGSIWQTGYEFALQGNHPEQHGTPTTDIAEAERLADKYAKSYGADRAQGQWGRALALYDHDKDRTVAYRCPDCGHEWARD